MDGQEAVAHGDAVRLDSQGEPGKVVNLSIGHLRRADLHAHAFYRHGRRDEHELRPFHAKMTADISLGRHEAAQLHPSLDADGVVFKGDLRVRQSLDLLDQELFQSLRMDAVISPLSARVTRTS